MNWEKYYVRYFKFKRASSHELIFLVLSQLDGSHLSRSTSRRYLSRYGWRHTWAQIVQPNLPALIESKNSFIILWLLWRTCIHFQWIDVVDKCWSVITQHFAVCVTDTICAETNESKKDQDKQRPNRGRKTNLTNLLAATQPNASKSTVIRSIAPRSSAILVAKLWNNETPSCSAVVIRCDVICWDVPPGCIKLQCWQVNLNFPRVSLSLCRETRKRMSKVTAE